MNKTAIKNFAIWARNKLIADISYRAGLMGITADGIKSALPQSAGTTEFYDIGTSEPYAIAGDAVKQRRHLVELIRTKEKETNYKNAYKYVLEEVAYTWFNRLIAVRFMEVNDYLPSHIRVLSSDSGKMEPDLVTTPFDAELSFTRDEEQRVYQLKQENKLDELFRMLFIKQCNALNELLPALFEKTSNYTELLLNLSVIDQDGVVYHLVHDIPEEDFDVERGGQVEIIGWLYQYYNTEPKNEAFAKKGKITKEEIPAVTQLFTPDWIVRYMVENSLGRLWVEGHPNDGLKAGWKYYLEEAEQEPEVQAKLAEIRAEYAKLNPEDIKVIDPCMGSGHILVYAFDVLMQIYESAGYSQRDAARSILENNLYGLDIDDRAFQMAYFAVMMKARQYNRRILNGDCRPNVYSIQESNEIDRDQLKYFGAGMNEFEKNNAITQMNGLLDTFKDAKEYGSILNVDQYDWDLLDRFISNVEMIGQMSMYTVGLEETAQDLKQMIAQGKVLAEKYHVTTTNPPYMAISNSSQKLNEYVKKHFPDSKADMFGVFIEQCMRMLNHCGYTAMITQHAWMFLTSFEKLRDALHSNGLINMVHLGTRAFEEIGGEVVQTTTFVFRKRYIGDYLSSFVRLVSFGGQDLKEQQFFNKANLYQSNVRSYDVLPNKVYAYWISSRLMSVFGKQSFDDFGNSCIGMRTGDNERFLRLWQEIDLTKLGLGFQSAEEAEKSKKKWFPYCKGGSFRKWYGNNDYVVNWERNGFEIKENTKKVYPYLGDNLGWKISNEQFYFFQGLTWSGVGANIFGVRSYPAGMIFDSGANSYFVKDSRNYLYFAGLMNTNLIDNIIKILNPTINTGCGVIASLPAIVDERKKTTINQLVTRNISLSKDDWDSFERSWDFKKHPLLNGTLISETFSIWKETTEKRFSELRKNEEELNAIFSDIYGVSDEIQAFVSPENVTVNKADLVREIKSLLSYAVGCMFGRYSLNNEGIVYAGGNWDMSNYASFIPDSDNVIPITDEEYLEDDIISRFCAFLKAAFGEGTLEENLNYIAKALGNKGDSSREVIRNYCLNDFFKDHCQTYSVTGSGKRPIYWLFDSGKQNGFKALIYLHRYNADTIGNLRVDYLHRMQRIYENEISRMQDMIDHSTNAREVAQATKRREKLTKQLKECREYDEKLAHLALSRIELDLDDGVKKNYRKIQTANDGKFYEVLADSKNIMAKE